MKLDYLRPFVLTSHNIKPFQKRILPEKHSIKKSGFFLHLPDLFFSHHVESLHEDVLHVGVDLREVVVRVENLHRHLGQDQGHVLRLLEVGHLGRVLAQRLQDRFLTKVKKYRMD